MWSNKRGGRSSNFEITDFSRDLFPLRYDNGCRHQLWGGVTGWSISTTDG
eukprot:JP437821.1.p4 GENE.JP437821.1~~JP437821.1.p4  ORF type:complete len:50 (-),score=0.02 JP437821.1:234-383(-)